MVIRLDGLPRLRVLQRRPIHGVDAALLS